MALTEAEIAFFTNSVAAFMLHENSVNQIRGSDLHRVVEKTFSSLPDDFKLPVRADVVGFDEPLKQRMKQENVIEIISTHIRSYGVLVRDYSGSDLFKFAHKSYFELISAEFAEHQVIHEDNQYFDVINKTFNVSIVGILEMPVARKLFCELLLEGMNSAEEVYDKCCDALLVPRHLKGFLPKLVRHALWIRVPCISLWVCSRFTTQVSGKQRRRSYARYITALSGIIMMATVLVFMLVSDREFYRAFLLAYLVAFWPVVGLCMPVRHAFLLSSEGCIFWTIVHSLGEENRLERWGGTGSVLAARLSAMHAEETIGVVAVQSAARSGGAAGG